MLEVLVWRLGWRIGQVCSIHQQPVTCNGSESPNGKKRLSQNSCTLLSQSHLLSTQLQTTPSPLFRLLPPPVTLNRPELPLAPGSLQIPSTPLQSNQSPAPSTLSTKSHSHCLQPWNERAETIASPQIGRYLTYLTTDHWPPK